MRGVTGSLRRAVALACSIAVVGCGGGGSSGASGGEHRFPGDGGAGGGSQGPTGASADLASLELLTPESTNVSCAPAFSPAVVLYTALAVGNVSTVRVRATPFESTATIKVQGTSVPAGTPSAPISTGSLGPTPVAVEVRSALGTIKTYTIVIGRDAPAAREAYVKASVVTPFTDGYGDRFGSHVALSGDTLAVASYDTSITGKGMGAVFVYVRRGTVWSEQARLTTANGDEWDEFGTGIGTSLAISGDTIVVGASTEASSASGVNGGSAAEADDGAPAAGAAYVFVRNGGTWAQQAYLKASNTDAFDQFGWSVAIDGDTIVVGAVGEDGQVAGVNPGASAEADNALAAAGAAYVFARTGTTWTQQAYLKASNPDASDYFGWAVAVSGDTVVVGAPSEKSVAQGVNGGAAAEADDSCSGTGVAPPPQSGAAGAGLSGAGAAYVFVRTQGAWSQQAYVKSSNTDYYWDLFGCSVAVSGDTMAVGAYKEHSLAVGVEPGGGGQADNSAGKSTGAGAVYVFTRTQGGWAQEAYIKASNTGDGDRFGECVALDRDLLVVGAPYEASGAAGIDGGAAAQADDSVPLAGAVYVFLRTGSTWWQASYVKPSSPPYAPPYPGSPYWFGHAIAVSGDTIAVGTPGDSSSATGVNPGAAAEADQGAPLSGAVSVYR